MPLWGPGRPRVSGMYEGWGLPGFLRNVTGQISQDCCPLAHLHSNDLHPWPHQTYPHLTVEKEQMRTMQVWDARHPNGNSRRNVLCTWGASRSRTRFPDGSFEGEWINSWGSYKHTRIQFTLTKYVNVKQCGFSYLFDMAELYECMYHLCWQRRPILGLWRWSCSAGRPRGWPGAPTVVGGCWTLAVPSREDLLSRCCCCLL